MGPCRVPSIHEAMTRGRGVPISVLLFGAIGAGVGIHFVVTRPSPRPAHSGSFAHDSRDGGVLLADPVSPPYEVAPRPSEMAQVERLLRDAGETDEAEALRIRTLVKDYLKRRARAGERLDERDRWLLRHLCRQLKDVSCSELPLER